MKGRGALRFIGEVTGITNGRTLLAAGMAVVSWLGMNASMRIIDGNRYMMQQRRMEYDIHKFIERDMAREMMKYRNMK